MFSAYIVKLYGRWLPKEAKRSGKKTLHAIETYLTSRLRVKESANVRVCMNFSRRKNCDLISHVNVFNQELHPAKHKHLSRVTHDA
jgi:hypothetical protein